MKIAIASGKGGTGKTTLSTNLSAYLSESSNVVLADLDVEEPDSGLFIQGTLQQQRVLYKMIPRWIRESCSHCGNCQRVCNFNAILSLPEEVVVLEQLCHSCYACSELCPTGSLPMEPQRMGELKHFRAGRLDFVESRLDIGQEHATPMIRQALDFLENEFPHETLRILDAPPGTSCPVIEVLSSTDLAILVTEPTPFGLHDLKLAVETVRQLGKQFGVVINRDGIGDDQVERYCLSEGIDLIARIPHRRSIAELYSGGKLLYPEVPEVEDALRKTLRFISEAAMRIAS